MTQKQDKLRAEELFRLKQRPAASAINDFIQEQAARISVLETALREIKLFVDAKSRLSMRLSDAWKIIDIIDNALQGDKE